MLCYVEEGTLYVVTVIMTTVMGQVVCANMPAYYSRTGMFDIVMCREGNIIYVVTV